MLSTKARLLTAAMSLAVISGCTAPDDETNAPGGDQSDEAFSGPSRVYFLDGFIFQLIVPSLDEAMERVEEHLAEKYPRVQFIRRHNFFWDSICDDLKELPPEEQPRKLILTGLSFGAWASVKIANCFPERTIDLMITIDTVDKVITSPGDIIPENVVENHNYFEDEGLLAGKQDNHREDGSHRDITNTHIVVDRFPAHFLIVSDIVDNGMYLGHIDRVLDSDGGEPLPDPSDPEEPTDPEPTFPDFEP